MDSTRRRFLGTAATLGVTGGVAGQAGAAERGSTPTRIVVGAGGDYTDIAAALADISDNSSTNPYQIVLLPGLYGAFDTKQYVDILGSGVKSSFIEAGGANGDFIRVGSNVSIANLGIRYSGTAAAGNIRGAMQKQTGSSQTEVILRDLEIQVRGVAGASAPKYAINFGGKVDITAYNLRIVTESGGIRLDAGQSRWHHCDIYLTGAQTGMGHYGIVLEEGNRCDFYGGRIGTGYYYDSDFRDDGQEVIGVYVPATNTSGNNRVQIHDAEMFARNSSPSPGPKVNAVRAENGWVRLFGCYCQSEISTAVDNIGRRSIYAAFRGPDQPATGQGGRVEAYGCRVRSFEGYVSGGAGVKGFFKYDASAHNTKIERFENLLLCDATDAPFTLKLIKGNPATDGDEHIFKKVDATPNPVTINGNGNLIDGAPSVELTAQYQTMRLRRAEGDWLIL